MRAKTGGRDFKIGERANPRGRPRSTPELNKAKQLNRVILDESLNRLLFMTKTELTAEKKKKSISSIEQLIIAVIEKAIRTGDHKKLEFILDRLIGKVKEDQQPVMSSHAQIVAKIEAENAKEDAR